jgi:hypothetical protein
MQRLEVSGAVRPLKWPLGVKWLIKRCFRKDGHRIIGRTTKLSQWIAVRSRKEQSVKTTPGATQVSIQFVTTAVSLGMKQPTRESVHSPLPTCEVKKAWSYTSNPPCAFVMCTRTILPVHLHVHITKLLISKVPRESSFSSRELLQLSKISSLP